MEEIKQNEVINQLLQELEEKVSSNSVIPEDFSNFLYGLKEARIKAQELLGLLKEDNPEFEKLFRKLSTQNYGDLVDDLNSLGFAYRQKNEKMRDAFNKMGYKIMEQTRVGKRDQVFYSLLRIHMSEGVPFNRKLLLAFKQPSEEMFKVLIFSFLSGILEDKKEVQD